MGLEEVKNEIMEKAERESERILAEGRREADAILAENRKKISEYRNDADKEVSKVVEAITMKELAGAEFDVKKMTLDRKRDAISKAMENAKKKLQEASDKQKESYIKTLTAKAKKETDVAFIYANRDDKKIVDRISGVKYKESEIAGGIIAENKDGTISIDYSYEELLDSIEKENLQRIAEILFGNKD